ncbi:MAG: dihydroorotate dehydrogenase electron transfer subunit [Nitrospirae bacterium]|nr:dihydroorotate dehydrogenase electron transfer subunit [Nitrospirota bacterium]
MIQTGTACDPLLKRPFSIYNFEQNHLSFLYRIRGKGTLSLSQLREGDVLQVIGPLGNSYPEPDGDFIAVAGGIGIASLLPLIRKYRQRAYLFYGAMNTGDLVMLEETRELAKEIFITTDDGSDGQKGWITHAVKDFLGELKIANQPSPRRKGALSIYACGPVPMLKALSEITRAAGLPCYASMEEHMACGIGACLGCVVKIADKRASLQRGAEAAGQFIYKRVCKEGPIFNIEDIVW